MKFPLVNFLFSPFAFNDSGYRQQPGKTSRASGRGTAPWKQPQSRVSRLAQPAGAGAEGPLKRALSAETPSTKEGLLKPGNRKWILLTFPMKYVDYLHSFRISYIISVTDIIYYGGIQ